MIMTAVTVDELIEITRTVVGEDEELIIDESILDTSFENLNFDSLNVIAIRAKLEQSHGFKFPEERNYALVTPRELVSIANGQLVN